MGLGSPLVAELLAHAGYDWLSIEMEHNGLDMAGVQQILMAMNATDCIPIARIPSSDPVFIQRALDIGAMGILVPMVRSAAEAEAIVRRHALSARRLAQLRPSARFKLHTRLRRVLRARQRQHARRPNAGDQRSV